MKKIENSLAAIFTSNADSCFASSKDNVLAQRRVEQPGLLRDVRHSALKQRIQISATAKVKIGYVSNRSMMTAAEDERIVILSESQVVNLNFRISF